MKKTGFLFLFLLTVSLINLQAKPVKVSFQTQDGWSISAAYQAPDKQSKTVVLLHDVAKSHREFEVFCGKVSEKGLGYLALDLRGHGESVSKGTYSSFAKEGVDNDYNKMVRDVSAAMNFLKEKGINEEDVFLVGVGLGASVAAKTSSMWPNVLGIALISPVTNFRDILTIPALRVYKGNVFLAAAADDKKAFLEASMMRNVSFLTAGEGKVTFATAYDKKSHELLDTWLSAELLQWLQTPVKPELLPDIVQMEEDPYNGAYETVAPSSTEEALFPSILQ